MPQPSKTPPSGPQPFPKVVQGDYSGTLQVYREPAESWKAVRLYWSDAEPRDLSIHAPLPYVKVEKNKTGDGGREMQKEIFLLLNEADPTLIQEGPKTSRYIPSVREALLEEAEVPRKKIIEHDVQSGLIEAARRSAPSDATFVHPEYRTKYNKFHECESKALLCHALSAWIVVEVKMKKEVRGEADRPRLRLWAFLQPASIGGNASPLAARNGWVSDDTPRQGWGEYLIDGAAQSLIRLRYKNGQKVEEKLPFSHVTVEIKGDIVRYKLKITIENALTPEDKKRREKGLPLHALQDVEGGCWMKVWVRNEALSWHKNPEDDRSEEIVTLMDNKDPWNTDAMFGGGKPGEHKEPKNHVWIRDRLADGREIEKGKFPKPEDTVLLYVALFSQEAINKLAELDEFLTDKEKNLEEVRMLLSVTAVSSGVMLLAFGLNQVKAHIDKKAKEKREKVENNGAIGMIEKNKVAKDPFSGGPFLVKILEQLDLTTLAAAYALDGFENLYPHKALSEAAKKKAAFTFVKALYDQILDLALSKNPEDYRKWNKERLKARQDYLAERLKAAEKDLEKNPELAKGLKKKKEILKLGVDKGALKFLEYGFEHTANLMELTAEHLFPKPAGMPLPIPGLQWLILAYGWSMKGSLQVVSRFLYEEEKNRFTVVLGLQASKDFAFSAVLDLHALWGKAGLGSGRNAGLREELLLEKQRPGQSDKDRRNRRFGLSEDEAIEKALSRSRGMEEFLFGKILKECLSLVDLHLYVKAEVTVKGFFGVKGTYDLEKGLCDFEGAQSEDFGVEVNLNAPLHAQVGKFPLRYSLANGKVGAADERALSLPGRMKVLGQDHKLWNPIEWPFPWSKGEFEENMTSPTGRYEVVWGKIFQLRLGYRKMSEPTIHLRFLSTVKGEEKEWKRIPVVADGKEGGRSFVSWQFAFTNTWRPEREPGTLYMPELWKEKPAEMKALLERLIGGKEAGSLPVRARKGKTVDVPPIQPLVFKRPLIHRHVYYPPDRKDVRRMGRLLLHVRIQHFFDKGLWVQVWEYSKFMSRAVRYHKKEWNFIPFDYFKAISDEGVEGAIPVACTGTHIEFPTKVGEGGSYELFLKLSLVPDESGCINQGYLPLFNPRPENWVSFVHY